MKNASAVGTPLYWPLQILKSESYTSKCDIWAVGCIFYEMMHAKTPWKASTEYELINNISNKPLIINSDFT
jgi:serine/threonine protein kinase